MHRPGEPEQQRKKQPCLVPDYPARETGLGQGLLLRVGDHSDVDVGVEVLIVGIAVMPVVFVHPPSVAHAEQPVPGHDPDQGVDPPARKHLSMPGVVQLKAELAGDESEDRRREDGRPDAVSQAKQPQAGREGDRVGDQHEGVVAGTFAEQPGGFDPPLELGVGLRAPRGKGGAENRDCCHCAPDSNREVGREACSRTTGRLSLGREPGAEA